LTDELPPPRKRLRQKPSTDAKASVNAKKNAAKKTIARAKRDIAKAESRLAEVEIVEVSVLDGRKTTLIEADKLEKAGSAVQSLIEQDKEVIFRPNPGPQTEFLAATETEVFFGGARGGGKSYATLADPLRYCHRPAHRVLILRRTMPELRDMIAKSQLMYPKAFPGARWRDNDKEWRFPSGARIEFGYAENMTDVLRYQGQSYTAIYVDELPQFPTPDIWNFLRSSLRSVDPEIPAVMRATGNPGNVGSPWVKAMFIDPAPANIPFEQEIKIQHPLKGPIVKKISRRYIPSSVFDNPYLTYDDSYVAMLASLPEIQRRQFLEGDWDAFDNAAFSEFRREVHVVDPFEVPLGWMKFRACDWGYRQPACCLWFAVSPDGDLYVYRELYVTQHTAEEFAAKVLDLEFGEAIRYGVLDASAWANRGESGPSIAETMIKAGCRWRPSDRSPRSRTNGWMELHRRLCIHEGDRAGIYFFSHCKNLIRTLPLMPIDANNPEDIDTDAEDHAADALRYGVMSRPMVMPLLFDNRDPSRSGSFAPADAMFGY